MRVAIVNYVWDPDLPSAEAALERFFTLTDWSDAILRAGAARVTVHQRFRTAGVVDRRGIRYRFWPDGGPPAAPIWTSGAAMLHEGVRHDRPDLVHVNGVFHPRRLRALRASLPADTALVVQDHGGFDPGAASRLKALWLRRGLAAADALLVSSPGQAAEWSRARLTPPGLRVADVMESGTLMAPVPCSDARRESGVVGSPALLWVGRLDRNKDPLTVLRGAAGFFERCPAARLTMVYGSGDLEPEVRGLVARTPILQPRVRLVGRLPRAAMTVYLSAADLFVLGSHREGSGYAAIEALACGALPVLTDIPSFRVLTGHGQAGELWPPGDAASLAVALHRAAARVSPVQRAACRTFFEERFSWPAIGRRAMEIYGEVIGNRTPAV